MREEEEVKPNTEFIAEIVTIVIKNKEITNNKDNFFCIVI
jgi:hypothetical protein